MRRTITIFIILLALFGLGYYIWQMRIVKPSTGQGTYAVPTDIPLKNCAKDDSDCAKDNEDIKAHNMKGIGADYAKQQCLNPINCKAPDDKAVENAKTAVRKYIKNKNLDLIKMGGITQNNLLFLCAQDTRCWSVDVRNNTVIKQYDSSQMPTTYSTPSS